MFFLSGMWTRIKIILMTVAFCEKHCGGKAEEMRKYKVSLDSNFIFLSMQGLSHAPKHLWTDLFI
jgi:hypothetical protein